MAKYLGVDIETPAEAQERLVQDQLRTMKAMNMNSHQQFGFQFANLMANIFGKGRYGDIGKAEKRGEQIEKSATGVEDWQKGLQATESRLRSHQQANEDDIRRKLAASGAAPELIEQAVATSNQAALQEREQVLSTIMKPHDLDESGDMSDDEVFSMKLRSGARALIGLGGIDNLAAAQQMLVNANTLDKQVELDALNKRKLTAETRIKEGEVGAYTRMKIAEEQYGINSPEYRKAQLDHTQSIHKVEKESGTAASADVSKKYGEYRKTAEQYNKSVELYERVYYQTDGEGNLKLDANGRPIMKEGLNPEAIAATGSAMSSMSDKLLAAEVWATAVDGKLGMGAISDLIAAAREDFVRDLVENAGLSQEDAIRIFQDTQDAVIAKARSFGGPITESDLAGAMSSLGLSTGRLDLVLERRGKELDDSLIGLTAQAEMESGAYAGTNLGSTLARERKRLDSSRSRGNALVYTAEALKADPASAPADSERGGREDATSDGSPAVEETAEERRKRLLGS
jgi:hypothetical protein